MKKLLIVEDNLLLRDALIRNLSEHYDIDTAQDFDQADKLIASKKYDIVSSDANIPRHEGDVPESLGFKVAELAKGRGIKTIGFSFNPEQLRGFDLVYDKRDSDAYLRRMEELAK